MQATAATWNKLGNGLAAALLALALLLPLCGLQTLPFVDLPLHLAEATALKHAADPASPLHASFQPVPHLWLQPGIAHAFLCSLFPSVEAGNRLLYALYALALPALMAVLGRRTGGAPAAAALAAVTVWNGNALWGFSGFTLGLPLVLATLLAHVRFLARPHPLGPVALGGLFLLLYGCHALLALFAGLSFALLETAAWLTRRSAARPALLRALALAPALLLLALWAHSGEAFAEGGTLPFLRTYYTHEYLPTLRQRLVNICTFDWGTLAAGRWTPWLCLTATLALALPAGAGLLARLARRGRPPLTLPQLATLAFLLAAALCAAFLPDRLPEQWALYQRFSVFVLLGLIAVMAWSLPPLLPHRLLAAYAACAVAAYLALSAGFFRAYRTAERDLIAFFQTAPGLSARRVAFLIDEPLVGGHPVFMHAANYQIVWNRQPTPTKMGSYRFGFLRQTGRLPLTDEWLATRDDDALRDQLLRWDTFDTFVTQGDRPARLLQTAPGMELRHRVGAWRLYQRHTL
jgi:hypothetical protein